MLHARAIRKSFGGNAVLDGVDVALRRGEVVLLRGANGSGKTTLLNILTGVLEPDSGRLEIRASGQSVDFDFPRPWWRATPASPSFSPESVVRAGVGRTWQDVRLFGSLSLADNLAVAATLPAHENPIAAILHPARTRRDLIASREIAAQALTRLGLAGRETSSADRISFGQSKRVAIARAVATGSRVLMLDEPLAGLDGTGVDEVLRLLQDLVRRDDLTLVIVEHAFQAPRILEFATTVWELDAGRLCSRTAADVATGPSRPYPVRENGAIGELFGGCPVTSEEDLGGGATLRTYRVREPERASPVLSVERLAARRGQRVLWGGAAGDEAGGLSFSVRDGELALLIAPNGWGKSTLVDVMAGFLPVSSGVFTLDGRPVESASTWQRVRLGLGVMRATETHFPSLTVGESLVLAGLASVPEELAPLVKRRVGSLSGGERQRVRLSTFLGRSDVKIAVLDEPFSALDAAGASWFARTLLVKPFSAMILALPGQLHHERSPT